jgi:tetratricopeptide (TPR) repeat protein
MSGYTTREVAELIGLTADQVRHYIRQGLLSPARGPRGEYRLNFQDILLLRLAKGLRAASVPSRRASGALRKLRRELAGTRSLASLRIQADGGNVVVCDERALWEVETGQGHLDFFTRELAGEVAQLRRQHLADPVGKLDSDDFYNLGVDLEDVDPARSADAYRKALELDPDNVDAHVNLGRLLQCEGHIEEARRHYQLTLARVPDHQLALYNLGTSFDEVEELDAAMECYRKADAVADAHYNLCRIFEIRGNEVAALRHLQRYRQLTSSNDDPGL